MTVSNVGLIINLYFKNESVICLLSCCTAVRYNVKFDSYSCTITVYVYGNVKQLVGMDVPLSPTSEGYKLRIRKIDDEEYLRSM